MLVMQDLAAFLDLPEAPKPEGLRGRKISLPTQESAAPEPTMLTSNTCISLPSSVETNGNGRTCEHD